MTIQERDLVALTRMSGPGTRALAELYDRYGTLLHSVACAALPNGTPEDVVEVMRDVWRMVWSRTAIYDPSVGPVALWLVLLARDRAVERGREMPPRAEAERLVAPAPRKQDRQAAATLEEIQTADHARNLLARLTPLERQAITAALFEKLTGERIAARLEVPEATVKQWIREGLGRICEGQPQEVPT